MPYIERRNEQYRKLSLSRNTKVEGITSVSFKHGEPARTDQRSRRTGNTTP